MRLVPCSQILEDLQESWVAPTFWLRFNSWTAATTAYTASKSRAEESCRGERGRGRRWIHYAFAPLPSHTHTHTDTHTHTHTQLQQNSKPTNCESNVLVVSGQWGVNPSPEWQRDYSIRSLERLWSADSVETISLSLSPGETLSFHLLSPMKLAHPDHSNYRLPLTVRARKQWERQPILSSPLYKQPHRHYRCSLLCTFD